MVKECQIDLTKDAQNDLIKVPVYIKEKLLLWVDAVERAGLNNIRKIPVTMTSHLKEKEKGSAL